MLSLFSECSEVIMVVYSQSPKIIRDTKTTFTPPTVNLSYPLALTPLVSVIRGMGMTPERDSQSNLKVQAAWPMCQSSCRLTILTDVTRRDKSSACLETTSWNKKLWQYLICTSQLLGHL